MSPEQVLGQPLTQQADIYSFGVLLYELFTGIKPFNGSSVNEIFEQVLFRPVDPAPLASLPEPVRAIILACTNKKLMERPATLGAVVEALVPPPAAAKSTHPLVLVVFGAVMVAIAIYAVTVLTSRYPSTSAPFAKLRCDPSAASH